MQHHLFEKNLFYLLPEDASVLQFGKALAGKVSVDGTGEDEQVVLR